jgi:hypothetical protein
VLAEAARDALDPRGRRLRVRPTAGGLNRIPSTPPNGAHAKPAQAPIEGEPA